MNLSTKPLSSHVSDMRGVPMLFTTDGHEAVDRVLAAMETAIMSAGEMAAGIGLVVGVVLIFSIAFMIMIWD